jgi:hypothetical protein
MSKFISDVLDEASVMLVKHHGWAYLDQMTDREQLEVINEYNDQQSKYIVVVFERNDKEVTFGSRIVTKEELELNQNIDESDYNFRTEEMEE